MKTILVFGATSKIGRPLIDFLNVIPTIKVIAVVRTRENAGSFEAKNISTVLIDLNIYESDGLSGLTGHMKEVNSVFLLTGYNVNMLAHSKAVIDASKAAGVEHIVHMGAYATTDTTIVHLGWHQLIEAYIKVSGMGYTFLHPNAFMQNIFMIAGKHRANPEIIEWYTGNASLSWVDCDDIALVASKVLSNPENYPGKTIPLAYDVASVPKIADLLGEVLQQKFIYQDKDPSVFFKNALKAGAEPVYMKCVENVLRRQGNGTLTEAADTFDNFESITGQKPVMLRDFIKKNKDILSY
jgi:NAD(P)H dehydrogenase (quinone)